MIGETSHQTKEVDIFTMLNAIYLLRAVAGRNYVFSFCMLSVLQVSVKVLNKESPPSAFDQFISDLEILSNLKHSNLAVLKVIHLHVRSHNFSA